MRYNFGVGIVYNKQVPINDSVEIKISKETAFLFIDGINICSIYPKYVTETELVSEIREWIEATNWINKRPTNEEIVQATKLVKESIM